MNPIASAILLSALVALTMRVGDQPTDDSTIASFLRSRILGDQWLSTGAGIPPLYVVREVRPDGMAAMRIINPSKESWDELARLMFERPDDVGSVAVSAEMQRSGLWAMTRHEQTLRVHWTEYGEAWTPEDQQRAQSAALAAFAHRNPAPMSGHVEYGPGTHSWRLWSGYLINIVTLAMVAGFVISLRWVPHVPQRIASARRRLTQKPWQCRACGYDLRGLEIDKCPECGGRTGPFCSTGP
jgi:hypothetical protein